MTPFQYGIQFLIERNHLDLSLADSMITYKRDYWDQHNLDSLTTPYNIVMFDAYVHHLPPVVKKFADSAKGNWKTFNDARRLFYLRQIEKNPTMNKHKRGWLSQINDLNKYCTIIEQEHS